MFPIHMSTCSSSLSNPDLSSIFQSLAGCRDQVWTVGWQLVIITTYSWLLLCRVDFRVLKAFCHWTRDDEGFFR